MNKHLPQVLCAENIIFLSFPKNTSSINQKGTFKLQLTSDSLLVVWTTDPTYLKGKLKRGIIVRVQKIKTFKLNTKKKHSTKNRKQCMQITEVFK